MQKLRTIQETQLRMTPQQIQFMNLLQLPTADLARKIRKETESNPALELEEEPAASPAPLGETAPKSNLAAPPKEIYPTSHTQSSLSYEKESLVTPTSWRDQLETQLSLLPLPEKERTVATYLIGALSPEGYLESRLSLIAEEMSLLYEREVSVQEVEAALKRIQQLDPPGIGARDLQESLLLQLHRKKPTPPIVAARQLIASSFVAFSKRHYKAIQEKMKWDVDFFKAVRQEVLQLSRQPIPSESEGQQSQALTADFFLQRQGDHFHIEIPKSSAAGLRIHQEYQALLVQYKKAKDKQLRHAIRFIEQNIQRAQWFMQALAQRQKTLLRIMKALLEAQRSFFEEEKIEHLKPLTLRQIAEKIQMDISTISRAISQKALQTDHQMYPLKFFFSEAIATQAGPPVSSRWVKELLKNAIAQEVPDKPYTDEALEEILQQQGILLARRTIAKYREQLGIPPARLRKEQ